MSAKQNKCSLPISDHSILCYSKQNSLFRKIIPKSLYLSPISCQPSWTLWMESDVIKTTAYRHQFLQSPLLSALTWSTNPLNSDETAIWQHLPHLSEGGALRAGAGWSFSLSLPLSLPLNLRSSLWHSNPHKVDDVMEVRQQAGAWEPAVMAVLLNTGLLQQSEKNTWNPGICAFSCQPTTHNLVRNSSVQTLD